MRRGSALVALAAFGLGVGVGACGHDFEPPDRAARVGRAAARYSTALFDTVAWDDERVRSEQGNLVYIVECRRCHGPLGRGDTDYARERGLSAPSLVESGWRLAQIDSLRFRLYVGHPSGMPIFGDGELSAREIDAAAAYILFTLRPEVGASD